jgi:hypothetical protein
MQPVVDADAKTHYVALPVGCCCGIGTFQQQLLRKNNITAPAINRCFKLINVKNTVVFT